MVPTEGEGFNIEENSQRRGSYGANLINLNFSVSLPVNKYIHTYIRQNTTSFDEYSEHLV